MNEKQPPKGVAPLGYMALLKRVWSWVTVEVGFKISCMFKILPSVSDHFLLPERYRTLSYFSSIMCTCMSSCGTPMIMDYTSETKLPLQWNAIPLWELLWPWCLSTATETLTKALILMLPPSLFFYLHIQILPNIWVLIQLSPTEVLRQLWLLPS